MYAEKRNEISEIAASLCIIENQNYLAVCPFCGKKKMSLLRCRGEIKFQCFRASCGKRGILNEKRTIQDVRGILFSRTKPRVKNYSDLPQFQTEITNYDAASKLVMQMGARFAFERKLCKLRYAARENRVLIFTRDEKGAVGRSVNDELPKWMVYGDCSSGIEVGNASTLVIVEDAFSACAVAQLKNYTGFALLGTKFKQEYRRVINKYAKCILCLDKDASRHSLSLIKEIQIPSTIRFLKRDIKYCEPDEIRRILL